MPGDGFGEEWQFREILKIVDDPNRRPVLVHCARGTCRTGAAVAIYRFERDGWTIEDVALEMRRQTYRYGWLPGYIYAMVQHKPARSFPRPEMLDDHNRLKETLHPTVSADVEPLIEEAPHDN
jgi:protein-tyrosine phosphatase